MPRTPRPDTLSQTQNRVLEAAARHPEHRLSRPEDIEPHTYRSALRALRRRGLVADTPATDGAADRSCRRPTGPVLSAAGLAQIAPVVVDDHRSPQPEAPTIRPPRPDSKLARLVALLARPDGASLDELAAPAGWLPHTTRAALTGLRKRGYALTTVRLPDATSRYRIVARDPAATDAAATTEIEAVAEEAAQ